MNCGQFSPSGTGITDLVSSLTILSLLSQGRMASLINRYMSLAEQFEGLVERECLDNHPMSCV